MAASRSLTFLLLAALIAVANCAYSVSFNHGVASGDPMSTSLVLWSRITPRATLSYGFSNTAQNGNVVPSTATLYNVTWTVFNQSDNTVAATGFKETNASVDYTVKVLATGLAPGQRYYFHFNVGATYSPRGFFRLPQPAGVAQSSLKYFIFSCSNWGFGYFNAYDVASRYDLDFWVHEGDWLYEYSVNDYPSPQQAGRYFPSPQGLQPEHEIETLADYRQRHATYRADAGLQALSGAAPLMSIWDDHEFYNNVYKDGGENQNVGDEPVALRKLAAVTAYREWMPIRDPSMGEDVYAINRTFTYGDLATIWMIEDRVTARTNAGSNVPAGTPGSIPSAFTTVGNLVASSDPMTWDRNATLQAALLQYKNTIDLARINPNQTQLGANQTAWLAQTTRAATNRTIWQLYNQGTIMQDWYLADPETAIAIKAQTDNVTAAYWQAVTNNITGSVPNATYTQWSPAVYAAANFSRVFPVSTSVRTSARTYLALGRYAVNWNADSWQGYLADRNRFLDAIEPALNAIMYTGDSHNFWAGYLYRVDLQEYLNTTSPIDPTGLPVYGVEFDTGSVTSTGFAESDEQPWPLDLFNAAWLAGNPNMFDVETRYHGGMYVELNRTNHHIENIYVNTVASTNYTAFCGSPFDVAARTSKAANQRAVRSTCRPIPAAAPYANAPTTTLFQPFIQDPAVILANGAFSRIPGLPAASQSSLLAPANSTVQPNIAG